MNKPELSPQPAAEKENSLLRCVLFTYFVSGAASQPLGSFIPYLQETYGFSYDFSGVLLSCQSVGNISAILLTAFLPTLLGRRRSILATSVWMGAAYLIFASGLGAPWLLALACLMTGVARGGNTNFTNTVVSTLTGKRAVMGYNLSHGCFAFGALLSPLLMIFFTSRLPAGGWRAMAAVLVGLVACQVFTYGRMPLPAEPAGPKSRSIDRSFLRHPRFWLGCLLLFCYISAEYAITGWLVTYFKDTGILPMALAQMMNSLLWLVIFIGRIGGALLAARLPARTLLLADGMGFFGFFLLLFCSRTAPMVAVGIAGMGLFMATIAPSAYALASPSFQGNDLGNGTMNLLGCAGGVVTPAIVGVVAEQMGIRAGMGLVLALSALMLAAILFSFRYTRRDGT